MKPCPKCGGARDRPGYCRACQAAYVREHRKPMTEEDRRKDRCRSFAGVYLRRGLLKRQPCVACGSDDAQMHHHDYDKPLEVIWMCRTCHLTLHRQKAWLHTTVQS